MEEHDRKIAFGFNIIKKTSTEPEEEKQLSLDRKSILIKNGESTSKENPLVIPVKPDTSHDILNSLVEKISQETKSGINGSDKQNNDIPQSDEDMKPPENESSDALAAREIMDLDITKEEESLTVQPSNSNLPNIDGEKESTLDDYERIPVSEFGMAMLRGMGCTPGKDMERNNGESTSKKAPLVIPVKPDTRPGILKSRVKKIHQKNKSKIKGSNKQNDDIPKPNEDMKPPENESSDALAAREIMDIDITKEEESLTAQPSSLSIIPTARKLPNIDGEKESTLEDYESIPISKFEEAIFRNMSQTPGRGMKKRKAANFTLPKLRPKGMGA